MHDLGSLQEVTEQLSVEIIKQLQGFQGTYAGLLMYMLKDVYDSLRYGSSGDMHRAFRTCISFLPKEIQDEVLPKFRALVRKSQQRTTMDDYQHRRHSSGVFRRYAWILADEISNKLEELGYYHKIRVLEAGKYGK